MSTAMHSKGPWWVTDHGIRNAAGFICALIRPGRYQGQDERYAQETAERKADAAVMAAAPELLEMLRIAVEVLQKVDPSGDPESDGILKATIEVSQGVIAKAVQP